MKWTVVMMVIILLACTREGLARSSFFRKAWNTASLSAPRYGLAAASSGDVAFFAGGTSSYARVDMYNASSNTWSATSLPTGRWGLSAAAVRDVVLFAGGEDGFGNLLLTVDVFNVTSGLWYTADIPDGLSRPRRDMAATSVANRYALFAGGLYTGQPEPYASEVDIYDAATGEWTTASFMIGRTGVAATSLDGMAFFAGGYFMSEAGDRLFFNTINIFHASDGSWTTASLSEPRAYLAATTVNGRALFAGGGNATGPVDVVDIYHASNNSWTTARLSQPRSGLVATSVGDLALFTGAGTTSVSQRVVDIYNATSNTWSTALLSQGRLYMAATSVGSLALFGGGLVSPFTSDVVDIFESEVPPPVLVSNTSGIVEVPVLQLNSNSSQVLVIPKDAKGTLQAERSIGVSFGDIVVKEINITNHQVLEVAAAAVTEGWRQVDDDELNSTASFLLTTELLVGQEQTESGATMEVQFYLFAADDDEEEGKKKSIDLGRNVTLSVQPSLAKFSLRFTNKWPFPSGGGGGGEASNVDETWLEMRIKVSPPFTKATRTHDNNEEEGEEEETGVTRFILEGQYDDADGGGGPPAKGVMRLVDTVEVDGETVIDGQAVQFEMDVATSELVLRFARFNSSLVYDPDLGVLFGPESGKGGGGDTNVAMIVGVSVAGGVVAVMIVVAAILGVWMGRQAKKRRAARIAHARELSL